MGRAGDGLAEPYVPAYSGRRAVGKAPETAARKGVPLRNA